MRSIRGGAILVLSCVTLAVAAGPGSARATGVSGPKDPVRSTSTSFLLVENAGQFDPAVRFQARAGGTTLWVTETSLWITRFEATTDHSRGLEGRGEPGPGRLARPRRGVNLHLTFPGHRADAVLEASDPGPSRMNYFQGSDPGRWRSGVRTYGAITWKGLYPGVSVSLREVEGEPALVVEAAPGEDPTALRVQVAGGSAIHGGPDGRLLADTPIGTVLLPALMQGDRIMSAHAEGLEASFNAGQGAAPIARLTQVPASGKGLEYGTFLGGSDYDTPTDVEVGADGGTYVTGFTYSPDFPTTPGAYDTTYDADYDAFVTRFDPTGATLAFSTFLGGQGRDVANAMEVGPDGTVYVAGRTTSPDFPVTPGAYDTTFDGGNGFITRLDPDGAALAWSTFLGSGLDLHGLMLALDGTVLVTGETQAEDFPTTPGAYDRVINDDGIGNFYDAFLSVLNAQGTDLLYSTFLGGRYSDYGYAVAIGPDGTPYVAGETQSFDFPTTQGAFDRTYNGGNTDAFVTRFNQTGSDLAFSTYLGGYEWDAGGAIEVDQGGSVYLTGDTGSPNYPTTPGAYDTSINSFILSDAFVTKLNPTASALLYSTFLGGNDSDFGQGLVLDPDGTVTVGGGTNSPDFPTTPGAFDRTLGGPGDGFVSRFDPTGSILAYSSYLGGAGRFVDSAFALAGAGPGVVTLTGPTSAEDFPTTPGAYDRTFNGAADAFVVTLEVARIMHVDRIVPRYRPHGPAYQVGAAIRIVDQTGSAVEGADVRVELTYPGGEEFVLTRPTGPHGVALVVRFATESGTYTFTVTDVAHPVAEYDPSQNAETSDSVTIP